MDTFLQKLAQAADNGSGRVFAPVARYYPDMDFLLYLNKDCSYRAERVDAFLTVLWDPQEDDLVGIKLKGFKFLFERIKSIVDLKDNDFLPLVKVLELALVGGVGEQIMVGFEKQREDHKQKLYDMARALAKDAVVLDQEWKKAA